MDLIIVLQELDLGQCKAECGQTMSNTDWEMFSRSIPHAPAQKITKPAAKYGVPLNVRKVSDGAKKPAERKPAAKQKPVSLLLILIAIKNLWASQSSIWYCAPSLLERQKPGDASDVPEESYCVGKLWTPVSYVAQAPLPAAPKRRVSQVEEERKKYEVQLRAQ